MKSKAENHRSAGGLEKKVDNRLILILIELGVERRGGERAIEEQTDLRLCFRDYTKEHDCLNDEEIIKVLEQLNMDWKDLRIIKNILAASSDQKNQLFRHISMP